MTELRKIFIFYCIYLFLALLGLYCCVGFSLAIAKRGYSLIIMHRPLFVMASLVAEHGL